MFFFLPLCSTVQRRCKGGNSRDGEHEIRFEPARFLEKQPLVRIIYSCRRSCMMSDVFQDTPSPSRMCLLCSPFSPHQLDKKHARVGFACCPGIG